MNAEPVMLRNGTVQLPGKISPNLLLEPMLGHTYLLEDGGQALIFDPSCGRCRPAREPPTHVRFPEGLHRQCGEAEGPCRGREGGSVTPGPRAGMGRPCGPIDVRILDDKLTEKEG